MGLRSSEFFFCHCGREIQKENCKFIISLKSCGKNSEPAKA